MKIRKVLNNNVVIAEDAAGKECVAIGKGIAYGCTAGDTLDQTRVEKVFSPREKGVAEKLSAMVESVPFEQVKVCDEIINTARQQLEGDIGDAIYLGLIDHITFALERHAEGIDIPSSLRWEMKHFYPEQYRVGKLALDIIEKRLGVRLPVDEAAFIAFHLVNAGSNPMGDKLAESLRMIKGILGLVTRRFDTKFDADGIPYNRFLTHLKFFAMRVFGSAQGPAVEDVSGGMLYRLCSDYPEEAACMEEIVHFVRENYGHKTSDDEKTYLLIHIHSLLTR